MVTNKIGPPVQGDDFFDREDVLASLWDLLNESQNILLLAPRRVGKTSLMLRLQEQARGLGYWPIFLSVASVPDEAAFIRRLTREVRKQLGLQPTWGEWFAESLWDPLLRRVRKAPGGVEFEAGPAADWNQQAERLLELTGRFHAPALVLIDELPVFVLKLIHADPTNARARDFLVWLRELRVGHRANRAFRWVLAGSVGLDTVTRRANVGDAINDLRLFADFGPFAPDVADRFLDALAKTYRLTLTEEVKARLRDKAGWLIPYHLQLFFAELRKICSDRSVAPTPGTVDEAAEALLLPGCRGYFDFWAQRLERDLGAAEGGHAFALLRAAADAPEGAAPEELRQALAARLTDAAEREKQYDFLMGVLQNDGYLVRHEGRFRFRSELLRHFWVSRFHDGRRP